MSERADSKGTKGRQAAYLARNRAALVKAGQEILADIGPGATIEQISAHAQISVTTLYKYFQSKELLFAESLSKMWADWVLWANDGGQAETLEQFLTSGRKLFWIKQTHPLFAKALTNTLQNPDFLINAVQGPASVSMKKFAEQGLVANSDFDIRLMLFARSFAGIMAAVHVTGELSPSQADTALALALKVFDVDQDLLKSILNKKLHFSPA